VLSGNSEVAGAGGRFPDHGAGSGQPRSIERNGVDVGIVEEGRNHPRTGETFQTRVIHGSLRGSEILCGFNFMSQDTRLIEIEPRLFVLKKNSHTQRRESLPLGRFPEWGEYLPCF